jgi:hypothetical protein
VDVTSTITHSAIDAVWRIESARLIAGLTRIVRDVGVAEELAQDALVAANIGPLITFAGTDSSNENMKN